MSEEPRVLIVEDERALALALAAAVRHSGAGSELAPTAAQARRKLNESGPFQAMILDIGLPDQNGLDFLGSLPEAMRVPTVVVSAHGEIGNTISARKLGVREFFTKPLDFDAFTGCLSGLLREVSATAMTSQVPGQSGESEVAFAGAAPAMRMVFQQIAHAAASREPVLIRGETGTGKTRVAGLIRHHSRAQDSPEATFSAGAPGVGGSLLETLNEGSGGSVLIENLTSLTAHDQAELLGWLESGGDQFPRVLATCDLSLREAVSRGEFRSDLYYRLQVLEIRLPALRERLEDLPVLVAYFVGQMVPGRRIEVSESAIKRLKAHDWPGNLRELRNVVSYALTTSAGASMIEVSHLPGYLGGVGTSETNDSGSLPEDLCRELSRWVGARLAGTETPTYRELSETVEAELIRELLRRFDGKLARMASELQANRATLRRKLREP
ncbi:MAG: sigma-54-dependent Fis family transcriptional regulator [Verrucomicrobiae bacterium]|nr:sigma-54-dependent Fis family transcriptional regulator [Verrucomicrobiae bacterium]